MRSRESGLGGDQVEGRNAVRELLRARRRRVRELWVAPGPATATVGRRDPGRWPPRPASGSARSRSEQLAARARTEAPQGVLARADPVVPTELDDLLGRPDAFLVALDGVTDPGNLGAVLRVAETAGVTGVVLPRHRSARLSPAAVKAAAGAIEHLPIATASGRAIASSTARRGPASGRSGSTPTGPPTSLRSTWPTDRSSSCSVPRVGDSHGSRASGAISWPGIPMRGALESLNVATAAAVACHAIARAGDTSSLPSPVAGVAQSAEQRFCKPQVIGSIPISGSSPRSFAK